MKFNNLIQKFHGLTKRSKSM